MLEDATESEQQILSQLGYQANEVILHTDTSLLPKQSGLGVMELLVERR